MTKEQSNFCIYNLKQNYYEQGTVILKTFESIESMMIIMHGELEIYTEFEGNDFILERLSKGSIINHRQFLMGDISQVNIRASEGS
jgi:CRP-like cAMP-binding protein